jgi:hypothetical protein
LYRAAFTVRLNVLINNALYDASDPALLSHDLMETYSRLTAEAGTPGQARLELMIESPQHVQLGIEVASLTAQRLARRIVLVNEASGQTANICPD